MEEMEINEDRALLWKFPTESKIVVLIVGDHELTEVLSNALATVSAKKNNEIKLLKSDSIANFLEYEPEPRSDFVYLVVDTRKTVIPEKLLESISFLGKTLLSNGLCLVNGTCSSGLFSEASTLHQFCSSHSLPLINCETQATDMKLLFQHAERMLEFVIKARMPVNGGLPAPIF